MVQLLYYAITSLLYYSFTHYSLRIPVLLFKFPSHECRRS